MSLDPEPRRSRRAILAAAAGGAAGLVAARLTGPEPAAAANPPLLVNQDNPTSATTSITTNGVNAFVVTTGTQAIAIRGISGSGTGIVGTSTSQPGVIGQSTSNSAVQGQSTSGAGVEGSSVGSDGVRGWSSTGTGVLGHVGGASPAAASGVALVGSVSDKAQVGIRASGRVQFPDRSGRATVAAGRSYVDVDLRLRGGLGGTPLCFANLASYRTGLYVAAVRPNYPGSGRLRIYLNKAATSSIYVAWAVLG